MASCHASCPQSLASVHDLSDAWRSSAQAWSKPLAESLNCDSGGFFGGGTGDWTAFAEPPNASVAWFRFTSAAGTAIATASARSVSW